MSFGKFISIMQVTMPNVSRTIKFHKILYINVITSVEFF